MPHAQTIPTLATIQALTFTPEAHSFMLDACRASTGVPCSPLMTTQELIKEVACGSVAPEFTEAELNAIKDAEAVALAQATAPTPQAPRTKKMGIGKYIVSYLSQGLSPKDVLALIGARFPEAKTSMACVYWYQSKLNTNAIDRVVIID